MADTRKAIAIIGSYRKGGIVDSAATEVLSALEDRGVSTRKIFLRDHRIAFCTNCRTCMQSPGSARGACILRDDMGLLLEQVEDADYLVLASPTNVGNVIALTRAFLERCVCYGYWPWGRPAPKKRRPRPSKKAVLISASAAPAFIGRHGNGTLRALKKLADMLDSRPVGTLWIGNVTHEEAALPAKIRHEATKAARRLTGGRPS